MASHLNLISNFVKNLRSMKGIIVKEFGGPEVCQFSSNLHINDPNDNQIQIKVEAAGVNPIDTYIRSGTHNVKPKLPYIPGFDSAGIITKLGNINSANNFKIGDRVFTIGSDTGTYAEYTLSHIDSVFHLPNKLSFEEGSALGIPYFTAYKALFLKGKAKPKETVLVHGASGSTGIACLQLAKSIGMTVIGTAGTQSGLNLVKKLGADYVFNHKSSGYLDEIKPIFSNGVDLILEMSGHINLNNDLELLKIKRGRIGIIGCRAPIEINPRLLMSRETSIFGVMTLLTDKEEREEINSHLQALIKLNCVKPVIAKVYPLENASLAQHDVITNTGSMGRLTLKI